MMSDLSMNNRRITVVLLQRLTEKITISFLLISKFFNYFWGLGMGEPKTYIKVRGWFMGIWELDLSFHCGVQKDQTQVVKRNNKCF